MSALIQLLPGQLWYLATVYSKHPDGLEAAFQMAAVAAARLLKAGVSTYSPIVHTHPIAIYGDMNPYDHALWLPFDELMMDRVDGLIVLTSDGWQESKGIAAELEHFKAAGKPIHYMSPAAT